MSQQRTRTAKPSDNHLAWRVRHHFATEAADARFGSLQGAILDMALGGPTRGTRRTSDAAMNDAVLIRQQEHRRMHAALASLPQRDQDVLWLAYGPHAWPGEVEARFVPLGQACGVVLLSSVAQRAFAADMKQRTARVPNEGVPATAQRALLAADAEAHLQAVGEVEERLRQVCQHARAATDAGERSELEEQAVALRRRLRALEAKGPRILPVRAAAASTPDGAIRVERVRRLGVGEWLRSRAAEKHLPAVIADAQAMLEAARSTMAAALRALDGPKPRASPSARKRKDAGAEFWPEATRGEVTLV